MPQPVDRSTAYLPALDGVRALAVLTVVGYHLAVPRMDGGLLGVSVFFTLSGFLITGILLDGLERTGRIDLGRFWVRRARRLLPALAVLLVAVLAMTAVLDRDAFARRWDETLAAAVYLSNWDQIRDGTSYADLFAGPQPLGHLWSLAVEEQFYLVWPPLLLVLVLLTRGRPRAMVRTTSLLAAASFVWMWILFEPGLDNTRAYLGTDARAGELLVGAVLAMVYRPTRLIVPRSRRTRIGVDLTGFAALAVLGWLVTSTTFHSAGLYRGGLFVTACCSVVLLVVATYPASFLGFVLALAPLRWLGERSYGIYLWHMPVVAFTPPDLLGDFSRWLAAFHVLLTLLLAALSWALVEDPIRRHGLVGSLRLLAPQRLFGGVHAPPVLAGSALLVVVSLATVSVATLFAPDRADLGSSSSGSALQSPDVAARDAARASPGAGRTAAATGGRPRTSCASVVHVGDSTSVGLMSTAVLPRPRDRIDARYRRVGVRDVETDIAGARSFVERFQGRPNASEAIAGRLDRGYDGCWVLAMGTNDTANRSVGGVPDLDERIAQVLERLDGAPSMWLTVRTLLRSGPWAEPHMRQWNDALRAACAKHPEMRIYDWASQAQDAWYLGDGIHFDATGYRMRARMTAKALTRAFPAAGTVSDRCGITV